MSMNIPVPTYDQFYEQVKCDLPKYCGDGGMRIKIQGRRFEEVTVDGHKHWFSRSPDPANVLAVAHTDTVQEGGLKFCLTKIYDDDVVFCPKLDDRLGVFIICHVLTQFEAGMDILLTDEEERCRSTARDFTPPFGVQYNWMFSFDREYGNPVCYQYDSKEVLDELEKHGMHVDNGTYSDICDLGRLMCGGINFPTGLTAGHSAMANANVGTCYKSVVKMLSFYRANKNRHFKHDGTSYGRMLGLGLDYDYSYAAWNQAHEWSTSGRGGRSYPDTTGRGAGWSRNDDDDAPDPNTFDVCDNCGTYSNEIRYWHESVLCEDCFEDMMDGGSLSAVGEKEEVRR